MLDTRLKKILNDLLISKSRTLLVLLSMIIGITGVGMVLNARAILTREMTKNYLLTNPSSAVLTVNGLNDSILTFVKTMPDFSNAEIRGTATGRVKLGNALGKEIRLFIVKDFTKIELDLFKPGKGKWPPEKGEVLIERAAMDMIKAKTENNLDVIIPGGTNTLLRLAGTVHAPALPPAWMEGIVFGFIGEDTYRLLGGTGGLNELHVVVSKDRFDKTSICNKVLKLKNELDQNGLKVEKVEVPEPGKHPHSTQMETLLFLLEAFGILALILSTVITANMISAIMAQQVRQIGIMKAFGGSSGKITAIYFGIVFLLGIIAVAAALPIADKAGKAYALFSAQVLNFNIYDDRIPFLTYLAQVMIGVLIPLITAVFPILKGGSITVREALQDYGTVQNTKAVEKENFLFRIKWLSRPFLLSIRNTFRKKGRLFFILAVLSIGGALFITAMNTGASMNSTTLGFINSFGYDVFATFGKPYPKGRLEETAMKTPGIKRAEGWSGAQAAPVYPNGMTGKTFNIMAIPGDTQFMKPAKLKSGRWLLPGDSNSIVINHAVAAAEPGLKTGDTVILNINGKQTAWKIMGIVTEIMSEPKAYVNQDYFMQAAGLEGLAQNVMVSLDTKDQHKIDAVSKEMETRLEAGGLEVIGISRLYDIRKRIEDHLFILAAMLVVMSFLGVIVGGLGLSTAMGMNVLERTREIGIMRAVGASTGSIFRMITGEGFILGFLSWMIAVVISLPFSVYISNTFGTIFFEAPLNTAFSVNGIFIWLGLALVFSGVSCLYPAGKAAGMSVREALIYE